VSYGHRFDEIKNAGLVLDDLSTHSSPNGDVKNYSDPRYATDKPPLSPLLQMLDSLDARLHSRIQDIDWFQR
jgi:hypothetical protein